MRHGQEALPSRSLSGWVDPATGEFTHALPMTTRVDGLGAIDSLLLTFNYRGHRFTIKGLGLTEMLWSKHADPGLRYFPA